VGDVFLEQFKTVAQVVNGNTLLREPRPLASIHILTLGIRGDALLADGLFLAASDLG
jgi:hypothetical protein